MSPKLKLASGISLAGMIVFTVFYGGETGAAAQSSTSQSAQSQSAQVFNQAFAPIADSATAPPQANPTSAPTDNPTTDAPDAASDSSNAGSLRELVAAQPHGGEMSRELNCLAGAVYFEAKGESLKGQLAVGRVVIARANSGRFPHSYCGVVYQQSQFSFIRGHAMPAIDKGSLSWRNAQAIAQIADSDSWKSPVEGALFFHSARISPNWHLKRIARIEGHVFYR